MGRVACERRRWHVPRDAWSSPFGGPSRTGRLLRVSYARLLVPPDLGVTRVISRLVRTAALAAAALLAVPAAVRAQVASPSGIPAYRSLIGFNPLGIPFDIASIEFETLLQQGITFGVSGSYVLWDDDDGGTGNR